MGVSRKTRYNARRRRSRSQRFVILAALSLALLASARVYSIVADPELSPAAVATLTALPASQQETPIPTESARVTETAVPGTPTITPTERPPILYYTQAGDTLQALAVRFGVLKSEITSPEPLVENGLFDPGQLLLIPQRLGQTTSDRQVMPDSEIVYSPSTVDFNIQEFVSNAGGYLSTFQEYLGSTGWTSGADIVARVALENSVNPRLLLSLLEYQSHWVYGKPNNLAETDYPMGFVELDKKGLYQQLTWAMQQLSEGYYGWREGRLTDLTYQDGTKLRLAPSLNAGSVALFYFFSRLDNPDLTNNALYGDQGLLAQHTYMFDSPWVRAQTVEPLFPATSVQPELILPFVRNQIWSFSGGPHAAWNAEGARAALDFAPASIENGCVKSNMWAVAAASGLVVRSGNGLVVIDLDGDGYEQTGWVLLYLHIATEGRIPAGTRVNVGDPIGHPSCEGGFATGTHIHIARKFNGEWIMADGPMPFNLSGWIAHAGNNPYEGTLTRDDQTVTACTCGSSETNVERK